MLYVTAFGFVGCSLFFLSFTISFVLSAFSVPLQPPFLITGRSWLVELSGPLIISPPARWLCTRRFSKPTCQPSRSTNHWRNTVIPDFAFSHTCIFFLLVLFPLIFFFFSLSDSSHLCFFICPYRWKFGLASKLPSMTREPVDREASFNAHLASSTRTNSR